MNQEPQQIPTQPLIEIAPVAASQPAPAPAPEGEDHHLRKRRTLPEIIRESVRLYFLPITATVRLALKLAGRPRLKKP